MTYLWQRGIAGQVRGRVGALLGRGVGGRVPSSGLDRQLRDEGGEPGVAAPWMTLLDSAALMARGNLACRLPEGETRWGNSMSRGVLYFDTNIYSFVAESGESEQVTEWLKAEGWKVEASGDNLTEILAIPALEARRKELACLTTVATSFESVPQSWLHALEVRKEIERCRPSWVRPVPDPGLIRTSQVLLNGHRALWREAKSQGAIELPHYPEFRTDSEKGISISRQSQAGMRRAKTGGAERLKLAVSGPSGVQVVCEFEIDDAETYWRADCLLVWQEAIMKRNPASRDYTDWLVPYVKPEAFGSRSYVDFWLRDVDADALPRNRMLGLVSHYQTRRKITHGNSIDLNHASAALGVKYLLTADKAFYEVLAEVLGKHYGKGHSALLVDRTRTSALEAIRAALLSRGQ